MVKFQLHQLSRDRCRVVHVIHFNLQYILSDILSGVKHGSNIGFLLNAVKCIISLLLVLKMH